MWYGSSDGERSRSGSGVCDVVYEKAEKTDVLYLGGYLRSQEMDGTRPLVQASPRSPLLTWLRIVSGDWTSVGP